MSQLLSTVRPISSCFLLVYPKGTGIPNHPVPKAVNSIYIPRRKSGIYWIQVRRAAAAAAAAAAVEISLWTR